MSNFDHFIGTRAVSGTHAFDTAALTAWLAQHGVRVTSSLYGGATRLRWVTHLDVSEADVNAALDCVSRFQMAA